MDNDYLAHYGVKGMKWGVRKDRGPKSGQRRSSNAQGGLRIAGNAARVVGRGVAVGGRAVGRGIAAGGRAIGSVPGRVQAANAQKHKEEAIEAIKRGDSKTVKKNMKYLTADEVRATLDSMAAEKKLMSDIDKNRQKTGAEKVADALNGIGDSKVGRAVKKGAAEGLQDVAKTVVKGVANDTSDTAAKAVGAGIGSAFTAWAMYKYANGPAPNYTQAFRSGAEASLRKAAKDKYGLDLSLTNTSKDSAKESGDSSKNPTTDERSVSASDRSKKNGVARDESKTNLWSIESSRAAIDSALRSTASRKVSGNPNSDIDVSQLVTKGAKAVAGGFIKFGEATGGRAYRMKEAAEERKRAATDPDAARVLEWKKRHYKQNADGTFSPRYTS